MSSLARREEYVAKNFLSGLYILHEYTSAVMKKNFQSQTVIVFVIRAFTFTPRVVEETFVI